MSDAGVIGYDARNSGSLDCTLAAISPKAEPFNWGNVLWHELGHVFAIQLSKSRVPRWFTEGLSEYETVRARPEWRRENDGLPVTGLAPSIAFAPVALLSRARQG